MNRNPATKTPGLPKEKEERLLELLGMEIGLFGQIREMTAAQTSLLEADDTEGFDRSLDSRQLIIERINELHQEKNDLMQSYMSFSETDTIETAAKRLEELITECAELNDKNTALAKEKAEGYVKQIGELSLKRKSLGKYALEVPNNPTIFDKKS